MKLDMIETVCHLQDEGLHPSHIQDVIRAAHSLHSLAEVECNTGLSPRQEKRKEKLQALILELLPTAKFSGDPRGYCVKIGLKSGRYNTWGGKECGWGI
mgnify:CR=1 FL=1